MALAVKLKGWDKIRANLRAIAERYPQELAYGLRQEGVEIMSDSAPQVPLDMNNLHEDGSPHLVDTGDVVGPTKDANGNWTVTLSYGNADDKTGDYVIPQHENLDFHHTTPGTKAKFLEDPVNARAPFIATNLIRAVNLERVGEGYQPKTLEQLREDLDYNRRLSKFSRIRIGSGSS